VKPRRMIYVVFLATLTLAIPAAFAEGWKMPNLNPFKKASASPDRAKASFSDNAKSGGLPKFAMPTWPSQSKKSQGPSTMQKLNKNTKEFFGKTKNVLMPWSTSSQKPTDSRKAKKKSFFSSWIPKPKREKEPPKTVTDFLGQERPRF
jgi:hypothetical protein